MYAFGSTGNQIGSFVTPSDIKVHSDLIYVSDRVAQELRYSEGQNMPIGNKANDLL